MLVYHSGIWYMLLHFYFVLMGSGKHMGSTGTGTPGGAPLSRILGISMCHLSGINTTKGCYPHLASKLAEEFF